MSKERLEEILKESPFNQHTEEFLIKLEDMNEITKIVQELELELNDWRAEVLKWQKFYKESEESHSETKELLKSIVNQNKRYREALEFYENPYNWQDGLVSMDAGEKARQALEREGRA